MQQEANAHICGPAGHMPAHPTNDGHLEDLKKRLADLGIDPSKPYIPQLLAQQGVQFRAQQGVPTEVMEKQEQQRQAATAASSSAAAVLVALLLVAVVAGWRAWRNVCDGEGAQRERKTPHSLLSTWAYGAGALQ